MIDSFGREINYLRISVTDRCNLRCSYCMPEKGVELIKHENILTFEEIERIVKIMASLGVKRIRLTGGEPLIRKDLLKLIKNLKSIEGIEYLGLTTNAILLENMAEDLLKSGVDGLNISLDTMCPEKYKNITKKNLFKEAFSGLEKAISLNFKAIKINAVVYPESSPEDWLEIIELGKNKNIDVRLIEWMPLSDENKNQGLNFLEMKNIIEKKFGQINLTQKENGGPAKMYNLKNFVGRVGIIGAMTNCFCNECNRVRLSADGDLKLCLFYNQGISLKKLIRSGYSDVELKNEIIKIILEKPEKHNGKIEISENENKSILNKKRTMSQIGG